MRLDLTELRDLEAKGVYAGEEVADRPRSAEIESAGAGGITFDASVGAAPAASEPRAHPQPGAGQAKLLRCRACARIQSARPAKPVPVLDFLEIDVVHLVDGAGAKHMALSMVDYASTYHVMARVKDAKAKTLTAAVRDYWVAWAGPPRTFSLDLDSGFRNVFEDGVWKDIWDRLVESEAVTESEVAWAMAEVTASQQRWLLATAVGLRSQPEAPWRRGRWGQ